MKAGTAQKSPTFRCGERVVLGSQTSSLFVRPLGRCPRLHAQAERASGGGALRPLGRGFADLMPSPLGKLTPFYSSAFHLILARLALHYDATRTFLKTGLRSFAPPSWPHGKLAFPIVLAKSAAVLPLEVRLVGILGTRRYLTEGSNLRRQRWCARRWTSASRPSSRTASARSTGRSSS